MLDKDKFQQRHTFFIPSIYTYVQVISISRESKNLKRGIDSPTRAREPTDGAGSLTRCYLSTEHREDGEAERERERERERETKRDVKDLKYRPVPCAISPKREIWLGGGGG